MLISFVPVLPLFGDWSCRHARHRRNIAKLFRNRPPYIAVSAATVVAGLFSGVGTARADDIPVLRNHHTGLRVRHYSDPGRLRTSFGDCNVTATPDVEGGGRGRERVGDHLPSNW